MEHRGGAARHTAGPPAAAPGLHEALRLPPLALKQIYFENVHSQSLRHAHYGA